MDIDGIIDILKKNAEKHPNDNRQIIKFKNDVFCGIQIGSVLSHIDYRLYEVYIHFKINDEVISQVLYTTFNNVKDATEYYNRIEEYIINFDIESILKEIELRKN